MTVRLRAALLAIAAVLTLSSCGSLWGGDDSTADEDLDRQPREVGSELPAIDTADYLLPTLVEQLAVVDPGWDLEVRQRGGVFLSAEETERALEFSAVDADGTTLWTAERPKACGGFSVAAGADGRDLAVLTDANTSEESVSEVTASAYDLRTGEPAWGPVEVPGPHQGPGLVFAAPPEGYIGESGERAALDPATGEVVAEPEGERILGEYEGTILSLGEETLNANRAGTTEWEIPLSEHEWDPESLEPFPGSREGEGYIHLEDEEGSGPVLDTESGEVLSESARDVARDLGGRATVVLDAEGILVIDESGERRLPISVPESTTLEAATGNLIYLREGGTVRAHNATTGSVAQAYPRDGKGDIGVPDLFTEAGTGTLRVGSTTLLATTRAGDGAPGTP